MKIKTSRYIYMEDLRQKCIEYDWYTKGDTRAYAAMLNKCNTEITDELLNELVEDIYEHSLMENTAHDAKLWIAWILVNKTARYNVWTKEDEE